MKAKTAKARYVVVAGMFIFLWVIVLKPQLDSLVSSGTLHPILAFIAFWGGIVLAVVAMLKALGERIKGRTKLLVAFTGVGWLWAFDAIMPPLLISSSGVVTTALTDAWYSSDVAVARILNAIGIYGGIVWWAVYILMPIFFLVILPVVTLKRKQLVELIKRAL